MDVSARAHSEIACSAVAGLHNSPDSLRYLVELTNPNKLLHTTAGSIMIQRGQDCQQQQW